MPYSHKEHKELTKAWYEKLSPETVVDIGAGSGTYADLLRPVKQGNWTAIEIYAPNETKFNLRDKYDRVIIADIKYIDPQFIRSDLTIAGDIIEHLNYDDVERILKKILNNCQHLLISLPIIHWDQHEVDGNIYETHQHHWSYDEIREQITKYGKIIEEAKGEVLGVFLVRGAL